MSRAVGKWCWTVLMLVAAALVAGCAAPVTVAGNPLAKPPGADESVVAVSVTGNTGQVTALDSVRVRRLSPVAAGQQPGEYILSRVAAGMARDTSLFVGTVPAGDYEVSRFENAETRRYLDLSPTMRDRIGHFRMVAGQPADLGRLILTPVNFNVVVGRSVKVADNKLLLERFAPQYAQLFTNSTATAWVAGRSANDKVEEYAFTGPVGASALVEQTDGRVVTASRLGVVLERAKDGRWRAITSPGIETLMDVLPVQRPDARLVAVGEFSTLLRLAPGASEMERIAPGNLPTGNLLFVAGNDQAGWYLLQQAGVSVQLLHSPRLVDGQWTVVRSESVERDFWRGGQRLWAWRTEGGLAYATSAGDIHLLDFASGKWQSRKAPNDNRLINVGPNADGSLGVLTSPGGGLGGAFAGNWLSTDQGRTWREVKSPFTVKVVPPIRTREGLYLSAGGVFGKPELQVSKDEGATWSKLSDHALDRTLNVLPSGLYFTVDSGATGLFAIRSSADQGVSWRTEYSTFDKAAYEAMEAARKK